jgi:hypothetical protein
MNTPENTEGKVMAISFPAPETTVDHRPERVGSDRSRASSLVVSVRHALLHGYERVSSAIFDADGDCMRL